MCRALLQGTASTRDVSREEVGRDTRALLSDLDDANVITDLLHTVDEMFPTEPVQVEMGNSSTRGVVHGS